MVFLNVTSSRHVTCLQSLACLLFFFFGYGVFFWSLLFVKGKKDEWLPPFIYLPNPPPQLPNISSRVISTFPCVLRDSDPPPPHRGILNVFCLFSVIPCDLRCRLAIVGRSRRSKVWRGDGVRSGAWRGGRGRSWRRGVYCCFWCHFFTHKCSALMDEASVWLGFVGLVWFGPRSSCLPGWQLVLGGGGEFKEKDQ